MLQGAAVPGPRTKAVPGCVMQEAAVIAPVVMVVSPGPAAAGCCLLWATRAEAPFGAQHTCCTRTRACAEVITRGTVCTKVVEEPLSVALAYICVVALWLQCQILCDCTVTRKAQAHRTSSGYGSQHTRAPHRRCRE